jgi:putative acetyltransferase
VQCLAVASKELTQQLSIRPYTPADSAATWQVFYDAIHGTASRDYTLPQVQAWAPERTNLDGWHQVRSAAHTLVACLDETVVGFSDVTDDGEVDMLFVHPDAGGRGVARVLLTQVLRHAVAAGHRRLVTHASLTSRPVFERFGFTVDAAQVVYKRGQELRNFDMSLVLTREAERPSDRSVD